jgi:hypothetical protein
VVAVAVQSVFRLEIHQNNIFFIFLKIIFNISTAFPNSSYLGLLPPEI